MTKICIDKMACLQMPNEFLTFRSTVTETRHPIRLYTRYINKVSTCSEHSELHACEHTASLDS